ADPVPPRPISAKPDMAHRVDSEGVPLPEGVVARLGSARLRHGGWVYDLCFSPDGKRIVSVGNDNTLRAWDGESGKQLFVVRRPEGGFDRVAFASDGKVIVVAGHDPK